MPPLRAKGIWLWQENAGSDMSNTIVRLDSTNWKDYTGRIAKLEQQLCGNAPLGIVLGSLSWLLDHFSIVKSDRYNDIADSYILMRNYMLKGYDDKHRTELYRQLVQKLYRLLSDLSLEAKLKFDPMATSLSTRQAENSMDIDGLREHLESFVTDQALLSLDGGDVISEFSENPSTQLKQLYDNRQKVISKAFVDIVRSGQWSREQSTDMTALLLSPTIDIVDAQVLCSAVMLAVLLSPDPYKVMALANIYKDAADTHLKQRALVGWVMALDAGDYSLFPELRNIINVLLDDDGVREDIVELQIQTIYCMGAEHDNETIRKDVMPTILKNQNLEITRYGIREKEDDPMDDILHGDETDKRMEEMEKTVQKMADMQKRGVDIYFGGFSKMKRFGFFYTLCNWFMPFFTQHPGLEHLSKQMLDSSFMKALFTSGPFCDSDKYSFALGLSSVYERLPENIREMLGNSSELHILGDSGANVSTPSYIRRLYLQDMYRFFRISDSRTLFHDPFSAAGGHLFMDSDVYAEKMHDEALRVVRFLLKRRQYDIAKDLLVRYYSQNNDEDMLLYARIMMSKQDFMAAEVFFTKVLEDDNKNIPALKGAALASFYNGKYDKAIKLYRSLSEKYPDKTQYRLNLSISLINGNEADEGINVLYELYYKYPDDKDIVRALAWGLLNAKRVSQAKKLYEEILSSDTKTAVDSLNAGYCAWFNGEMEKAVELFRDYLKAADPSEKDLMEKFDEDKRILDKYGIPQVNRLLMAGIKG